MKKYDAVVIGAAVGRPAGVELHLAGEPAVLQAENLFRRFAGKIRRIAEQGEKLAASAVGSLQPVQIQVAAVGCQISPRLVGISLRKAAAVDGIAVPVKETDWVHGPSPPLKKHFQSR